MTVFWRLSCMVILTSWSSSRIPPTTTNGFVSKVPASFYRTRTTLQQHGVAREPIDNTRHHDKNGRYQNHKNRNRRGAGNRNMPRSLNEELVQLSKQRHSLAATRAQDRLEVALNENESFVDEVSFNIVIMGYAKQQQQIRNNNTTQPAQQALNLLRRMESTSSLSRPSAFTYNAVMEACSHSLDTANELFQLFEQLKQHRTLEPNTYSYNLMLQTLTNNAKHKPPKQQEQVGQALQLFEEMKEGPSTIQPDRKTISVILNLLGHFGKAVEARSALDYAWRRYRSGARDLQPNTVWYNCVIYASRQAGRVADELLQEMQSLYELGQVSLRPDTTSYNQVMNAHASLGNTTRVTELLEELEYRYTMTGEPDLEPDTISYSTSIKAFLYSKQTDAAGNSNDKAATQALSILRRMEQLYQAGRTKLKPTLITYNSVLTIWSKLATESALETATKLLREMQDNPDIPNPDERSFVALIHGWSKSGLRHAGQKGQDFLYELVELLPTSREKNRVQWTVLTNAVIKAWAKSGDKQAAPTHVEQLLDFLLQLHTQGIKNSCPSTVTFLSVIDAYAKSSITDAPEKCNHLLSQMDDLEQQGAKNLQKSRSLYTTVLNALAKSCQPGVAIQAEEVVAKMEKSNDAECRPDIKTYSALISCYTKSGEPPLRAQELLQHVEETYAETKDELLKPNPVFYSTIQQAWAKSASSEGADKAEELLRRNELMYTKNGIEYAKPHAIVYNAVMDAIARSGDALSGRRAEALLVELQDAYRGGDHDLKPTRRSFAAVMLAYRRDGNVDKVLELLKRMENLQQEGIPNVKPSVVDYNCAIGALAASNNADAADKARVLLDRARLLAKEGNLAVQPNETTFAGVIKAYMKQKDDEASRLRAKEILQEYIEYARQSNPGQSNEAIETMKQALKGEMTNTLTESQEEEEEM